jgi:CysZ protein
MLRESLGNVSAGFLLPLEGARLLLRERRLWAPALVPLLLSLLAFALAAAGLVAYADPLFAWLTAWMPALEPSSWISWLWIGPAKLGLLLLGAALFALAAGLCLVVAYLLASLLASPFHDALAGRVERLVTGAAPAADAAGAGAQLRAAARALREELRRLLFLASLALPLATLGFLLPPAQLLTGPALLLLTLFFLPLDYASYCLDRRRLSFAEKRRWLLAQAPAALGFGGAAFLACVLPGANLLAMPALVVGGTLLALRSERARTAKTSDELEVGA